MGRGEVHARVARRIVAAGVALAAISAAPPPVDPSAVAAPAAAPSGSLQDRYNAAQSAFDRGDWSAAAAGFLPLLPADAAPLSRSRAVIAERLAEALLRLGQNEEARRWITRALPALPDRDEMAPEAWIAAGEIDVQLEDYSGATAAYAKAAALAMDGASGDTIDAALYGIAANGITTDPASTGRLLDDLLARPSAKTVDPKILTAIEDFRARAALNAGDREAATNWINRALARTGAMSDRINYLQATVRGDAALIARLRGADDDARRYLTYTGAGHQSDLDWIGDYKGDLPVCGDGDGPRPDDSAVVQFVLGDDGRVTAAIPVYATRTGGIGVTFAQAVASWRWPPAMLTKVDPFWRATLRLELRCVTRPAATSLSRPYLDEAIAWYAQHGSDTPQAKSPAGEELELAALRRSLPSGGFAKIVPALEQQGAPASVYAVIASAMASSISSESVRTYAYGRARNLAPMVEIVARTFPDAPSTAWLELELAIERESAGNFTDALPLLTTVVAFPESKLPADDPVRRVALLHEAIVEQKLGRVADAKASLALSGLSADQCSLLDTRPVPQSVAMASNDFPSEALRWHFEGWVREAFDVAADGTVSNVRTIAAYPPFIFGHDTEAAVRRFRYIPPTIDGKSVGCINQTQGVAYRIPS